MEKREGGREWTGEDGGNDGTEGVKSEVDGGGECTQTQERGEIE